MPAAKKPPKTMTRSARLKKYESVYVKALRRGGTGSASKPKVRKAPRKSPRHESFRVHSGTVQMKTYRDNGTIYWKPTRLTIADLDRGHRLPRRRTTSPRLKTKIKPKTKTRRPRVKPRPKSPKDKRKTKRTTKSPKPRSKRLTTYQKFVKTESKKSMYKNMAPKDRMSAIGAAWNVLKTKK